MIIDFQIKHGLTADGLVGKNTSRKIKDVFFDGNKFQTAHFLGQIYVESGGFRKCEENLNYSAEELLTTFRTHFISLAEANLYAHNPEAIANKVYANRVGNGDEKSGDGWKYRGRGAIQLTGRYNYERYAKSVDDNEIIENPNVICREYYLDSAVWFFDTQHIWHLCTDVRDSTIKMVSHYVNGGLNGLKERIKMTNYFYILIS